VEEGVKQPKPVKVWAKVGCLGNDTPYICWADDMRWSRKEAIYADPCAKWIRVEIRPVPVKSAKKREKGKR
jgi:hypothetical protein